MRWWAVLALSGCAKAPLEMHLDGLPSPWLTLEPDGRIVAYNGDLTGTYDAATETIRVDDPEWPHTVGELDGLRRKCAPLRGGAFQCEHQVGHFEPWRGEWEPAHDALFSQLWLWDAPQPLLVVLMVWEDNERLAEGSAAVFRDGTIRTDNCRVPFLAACERMPEVIGTWSPEQIVLLDGTTYDVIERPCLNGWCAERHLPGPGRREETFELTPTPRTRVLPSFSAFGGAEIEPVMLRVAFALAAHRMLEQLEPYDVWYTRRGGRMRSPP
jgi:hypothetical protein